MNLLDQIAGGEGKTTEFKRELPKSDGLIKTVVAFANTGGGRLIVGIGDKGAIEGVPVQQVAEDMDRISNMIHDQIHPFLLPDIYSFAVEDKNLIVVEVFPSPILPHFIKSAGKEHGTYIRVGATNKRADIPYIQELERQKHHISYDAQPYRCLEVSKEQTRQLKEMLKLRTGISFSDTDLMNKRLMVRESGELYYTNASAILMGVHENVRLRCARFKGIEPNVFIDRKVFEGDLFSQIEAGMNFLLTHINLHGEIGADFMKRIDTYEIPPEALREALLNAVIHRNYATMNSDIKVAVFDDRVEITSPGDLPNGITLEEALSGRSEIRNRVTANLFECAELVEQWGRGIRKLFSLCETAGLRRPEITESGMFVQVRFYRERQNAGEKADGKSERERKRTNEESERKKADAKERTRKANGKKRTQRMNGIYGGGYLLLRDSAALTIKMREKQLIIDFIAAEKSVSASQIMELLGLKKTRTVMLLSELVEEGRLIREGRSRAVRYRLNKQPSK